MCVCNICAFVIQSVKSNYHSLLQTIAPKTLHLRFNHFEYHTNT